MNVECVNRQSFGARFETTANDASLANRILAGRLSMSPHPEWRIPNDPTWTEDPFGDDNWQFQYHSLRWLDPLRRRALTGDRESFLAWERFAKSWIEKNPPGKSPTKWAWFDMGDALRTFELVFATAMYDEVPSWLADSLSAHAQWLADENNLGHGNHALHQHQALFVVGSALEDTKLVSLAVSRIGDMASRSYDDQGINEEGSISYQEANYRWWKETIRRLQLEGLTLPEWAARIEATPESLAHATQPDGNYVRIGDMDSGRPSKIDSPFTKYVSSSGAEGIAPKDLIKVYDRGYVFGRSGWGETERDFSEETFFSLCFGAQQKIHGHADGGSLTYFSKGQPWLVDTGKFTYGAHPMRRYVVNRQGHNLLVAPELKYDRSSEVTLFRVDDTSRHFEAVTRDTGYEGVLITRRLIYSKRGEYVLTLDAVSAQEPVTIEQRWHVDHQTEVEVTGDTARLVRGKTDNSIQWIGRVGQISTFRGDTNPHNGWMSVGWRKSKATTVISARQNGTQLTFRTVIGASLSHAKESATVRKVADGYVEYSVRGRVGMEYILVGKRNVIISDHPFQDEQIGKYFEKAQPVKAQEIKSASEIIGALPLASSSIDQRKLAFSQMWREIEKLGVDKAYRSGHIAGLIDIAGKDMALPDAVKDAGKSRAPIIAWDKNLILKNRAGNVQSYTSRTSAAKDFGYEGIQSYRFGELTLPVASIAGSGETLHVSFHGALDRGKYALPRFERGQSLRGLGLNQLVFADPTLDLDPNLALAWFLGTESQDLHEEIAQFVKERMTALGITKVVLSGSSGGGFAALQVAAFLPESQVLVFNPQTSVTSYHPRLAQKATDLVFPGLDLTQTPVRVRLEAAARYRHLGSRTDIVFVQNDGDTHHSTEHREPFLLAVADLPGISVRTITESWGAGHRSPKTDVYLRHLRGIGLPVGSSLLN